MRATILFCYRNYLHIFRQSSTTVARCWNENPDPNVTLYIVAVKSAFVLMDDNTRLYTAVSIEDNLECESIARMDWSAYSSDFKRFRDFPVRLTGNVILPIIICPYGHP